MTTWRDHDARLVPAAGLVWAASAFGELGWRSVLWSLAGSCVLLALLTVPIASWTSLRRGLLLLVALSLLAGAAVALLAGLRLQQRESSPLTTAARADGFVRIEGQAASRPRAVGDDRMVVVDVQVHTVTYRGISSEVDAAAVVMGEGSAWMTALPGMPVTVTGVAHVPSVASSVVALVVDSGGSRLGSHAPRWSVVAQQVRDGLARAAAVNDPDAAGLLVALVDGDTSGISDLRTEEFRRSGLAHLLAVSGANVAIVTGAALWVLRLLRAAFPLQVAGAAAALLAFVLVAGPEPSVLRAAGMGVVMLIALASGRPRAAVPALCAAVVVLLLAVPQLATSVGFILSVLATAGVVVLGAHWTGKLKERMPTWLAAAISVAAAAAVVTLPVIVLLLPMVNLSSVLANLLAAPAVPLATICGVTAALWAPICMPVAQLLCWVAGFCVRWIALVAHIAAQPGPFQVPLPAGLLAAVIVLLVGVALALLAVCGRRRPRVRTAMAAALVGVVVLSVPVRCAVSDWPPRDWLFAACDVGQGDATLARADDGAAVLLDAGPDAGPLDECLAELGISEVPLAVLTHFHDDHISGIPAVLGRRDVEQLVFGTFDGGSAEQSIRSSAAAGEARVIEVGAGWTTQVGEVRLETVGPVEPILGTTSDPNNNSLVLRVTVRGVTMLVTGDLQQEAMVALAGCGCLRADVLKVPHHGSKNRDDGFLAQTGAKLALISVGEANDYGHPAPSTVAELRRLGMTVRRTDVDGTVVVVPTNGGGLALV